MRIIGTENRSCRPPSEVVGKKYVALILHMALDEASIFSSILVILSSKVAAFQTPISSKAMADLVNALIH